MLDKHVHHLPVTDGNRLTGIITDRDIKPLPGPEPGSPDPRELTVDWPKSLPVWTPDASSTIIYRKPGTHTRRQPEPAIYIQEQ